MKKSIKYLENGTIQITDENKKYILIGTAHVSSESAQLVQRVVDDQKPDTVCIELDQGRFQTITQKQAWSDTAFVHVIKDGRAGFMFINILLSHYQQKIAEQLGVQTGGEMLEAMDAAKEVGADVVLADRDIQITFNRIWRGASLWEKCKLMVSIILSLFDNETLSEEDIEQLKEEDMLNASLAALSEHYHGIKRYLVDERDIYLCEKIKRAPGQCIVAVVGAAHIPGILKNWTETHRLEPLETAPPKSKTGKVIGWAVSALLVLMVILTLLISPRAGWAQTHHWLLLTMGGAGIGALVSLAHPLTILVSIAMAPISALSPVLATGWFAGISEAHWRKPRVTDFESLSRDLNHIKGIWHNQITRVLLVVILTNLGCALGNIVGSLHIIQVFLRTLF